jgi:hypothetical protein
LPEGDPAAACGRETPVFLEDLNWAIDTLAVEHPEYFDGFQVHNVGAYFVGIIRILDRKGICAYTTDGEEIGIKSSNELGEQYDIMSARYQVRRYYVGTCRPAAFPVGEAPLTPPPPGCTLPPSRMAACGEPPPRFYEDVEAAIGQVLSERPELFDHSDVVPGNLWPRITNMTAYQNAIGSILGAKGYCGLYDGEQIAIKKGTNEFNEQYDINYADAYIRRGPGIYKGACYPAIF